MYLQNYLGVKEMFKQKTNKFASRLESVIWMVLLLLPVAVMIYHRDAGYTLTDAVNLCSPFPYLQNIFESVFSTVFTDAIPFCSYLAWFCLVEISRVMVSAVLFIPRFARKMLEGWSI